MGKQISFFIPDEYLPRLIRRAGRNYRRLSDELRCIVFSALDEEFPSLDLQDQPAQGAAVAESEAAHAG